MEESLQFIDEIHDSPNHVLGEIYMVRNKLDGKCYIGQTVSHRLNHGRYRPFGYARRFKSHVSEAMCNRKKHQCSCLANAIRKHGSENFEVVLLQRCFRHELDDTEARCIGEYGCIHPNGYNLAPGGRIKYSVSTNEFEEVERFDYTPMDRNAPRSQETIQKIKDGNRKFRDKNSMYMDEVFRSLKDKRNDKKMKLFEDEAVEEPLSQYIRTKGKRVHIMINGKTATFESQYENKEESIQRALNFLEKLKLNTTVATSSN
jgi:hypothetical protein